MSTQSTRLAARFMVAPSVIVLFIWMIVPLAMTAWFSFRLYRLLSPDRTGWVGFNNYVWFFNSPDFWLAMFNTLALVGGVLVITVVLGILIALLIDQPVKGQGVLRILVIAPFFVMPPVAASIWENLFMHPQNGLFAAIARGFGSDPILFLENYPMPSVIGIVAWEWLPFATLILLTAMQSLSSEQLEAAEMDGASAFSRFRYIILPHLTRAITVVVLIQTIFLLGIFGEIYTTTQGGPGSASTTLPYMIFKQAIVAKDIGRAAAGGIIAVILANIVAYFLMRSIGKHLDALKEAPMARAVSPRRKLLTTLAAWFVACLIFFPVFWMILTSFKTEASAVASPPELLGADWTLENYVEVWSRSDYPRFFWNSVVISVGSTLLGLAIAIPSAWAMAFVPGKRTKDLLMWMLSTKMMPAVAVMIPIYLLFQQLGLFDTKIGLILALMLMNLPIIIWMLYTYFKEIPGEILEAARMDGASLWNEILYVLTPMAIPGIASTMLLNVILAWNEAFWTITLTTTKAAPLSAFIASFSAPQGLFYAKLSAASAMAIMPILILGWFSQKQLVRGLTFGAVK